MVVLLLLDETSTSDAMNVKYLTTLPILWQVQGSSAVEELMNF